MGAQLFSWNFSLTLISAVIKKGGLFIDSYMLSWRNTCRPLACHTPKASYCCCFRKRLFITLVVVLLKRYLKMFKISFFFFKSYHRLPKFQVIKYLILASLFFLLSTCTLSLKFCWNKFSCARLVVRYWDFQNTYTLLFSQLLIVRHPPGTAQTHWVDGFVNEEDKIFLS